MIVPVKFDNEKPVKWINPKHLVSIDIIEHDIKNIEVVFLMTIGKFSLKFKNPTKWRKFYNNELQVILDNFDEWKNNKVDDKNVQG